MNTVSLAINYKKAILPFGFLWEFEAYIDDQKIVPRQRFGQAFEGTAIVEPGMHKLEFRQIRVRSNRRSSAFFELMVPAEDGCALDLRVSLIYGTWFEPVIRSVKK